MQNYQAQADLYRKAALLGNAEAQRTLGAMHAEGRGMPIDLVQAHQWFNLAALSGKEGAGMDMKRLENRMTRAQIEQARKKVQKWLEQHK